MQPISSTAKLLLNKEESTTIPKMLADVVMDDIAVLISRQQVNNFPKKKILQQLRITSHFPFNFIICYSVVFEHGGSVRRLPNDVPEPTIPEVLPGCDAEGQRLSMVEVRVHFGSRGSYQTFLMGEN